MKTIVCSRCEKDVQVEDSYFNKCCPICLAKKKADYAVESAEKDFDKESEKQLKSLFGEKYPEHLSYGKMKEHYQNYWHKDLSWEEYLREIQKIAIHRIQRNSDEKIKEIRGEKAKRIKDNAKFLDFDLYPPSNRDECKKFRHQAMGSYPQSSVFMEEHIAECPECKMWNQVKESGMLNAEGTSEIWQEENQAQNIINLTPCDSEKCKTFRNAYVNFNMPNMDWGIQNHNAVCSSCGKWVVEYRTLIGEIKKPETIEEWEEQQGWKQCCSNCGTVLVNGKCPNCQPNT